MNIQTLLLQAEECADVALDKIHEQRGELMEVGLTAYQLGVITGKLADIVGQLHTARRMMPGYQRNGGASSHS